MWVPLQIVPLILSSGNQYSDFLNLSLVLLTLQLHIESKSESFFFLIYYLFIYFESGYQSSLGSSQTLNPPVSASHALGLPGL